MCLISGCSLLKSHAYRLKKTHLMRVVAFCVIGDIMKISVMSKCNAHLFTYSAMI